MGEELVIAAADTPEAAHLEKEEIEDVMDMFYDIWGNIDARDEADRGEHACILEGSEGETNCIPGGVVAEASVSLKEAAMAAHPLEEGARQHASLLSSELFILGSLNHPNVLRTFGGYLKNCNGGHYLVLEQCQGNLASLLASLPQPLTIDKVLQVCTIF